MHTLMIDKGFVKKTRGQKVAQMQVERTEKQFRQIEGSFSLYDTITGLYIVVFVVVTAGKYKELQALNKFNNVLHACFTKSKFCIKKQKEIL